MWSDESAVFVFGHNDVQYVWRPQNKAMDPRYTLPTVKHGGGSIMVWACFSSKGVGRIHLVVGLTANFVEVH